MKLVASELRALKLKQAASHEALKQVKLVASELCLIKLKQVVSPEALMQVKLIASELRPLEMKQVLNPISPKLPKLPKPQSRVVNFPAPPNTRFLGNQGVSGERLGFRIWDLG